MAKKKGDKKRRKLSLKKVKEKVKPSDESLEQPSAPRITNETVEKHREEVLGGARRFIYPLQHSKHRVVIISSIIVAAVILLIIISSILLLYRYKSTSDFAYRMTQIFPFPIARVNGEFVPYEDYLFEVRHVTYYYRTHAQEGVDIDSKEGQEVLEETKKQALQKVKLDALARQIAEENDITVGRDEIDEQVEYVQNQGGIGESDDVLSDVLQDFYNWDIGDLKRVINLQLTRQKLPTVLDTQTINKANRVYARVKKGDDFAKLAKAFSDDQLTKDNGGVIGMISRSNTDLPPEFIEAAFKLKVSETSEVVQSQFGLHIIKNQKRKGKQIEVAHILMRYFDVDQYLREQLQNAEVSTYITL